MTPSVTRRFGSLFMSGPAHWTPIMGSEPAGWTRSSHRTLIPQSGQTCRGCQEGTLDRVTRGGVGRQFTPSAATGRTPPLVPPDLLKLHPAARRRAVVRHTSHKHRPRWPCLCPPQLRRRVWPWTWSFRFLWTWLTWGTGTGCRRRSSSRLPSPSVW